MQEANTKMISEIALEIIQKCPNNCIYCSSCSSWKADLQLDYNTIKSVIDDMAELGIRKLCLSGGEPFLHCDIKKIIAYATGNGIDVSIYSSGIVGIQGNEKELEYSSLSNYKQAGLTRIIFNMQASEESIYDSIMRTSGNFPKLLNSIKNANKADIRTEIHFVPMKLNIGQVYSVIKLAEEIGINTVSFLKLVSQGRALENKNLIELNEKEYEIFYSQLQTFLGKSKINIRLGIPLAGSIAKMKCHAVTGKIAIRYDGAVLGCEAFKGLPLKNELGKTVSPDNIKTRRLRELVNHSTYLNICHQFIERYSLKAMGCENCPVQEYMKEHNNG